MNTTPMLVQVTASVLGLGGAVALAVHLARASAPDLAELLNRYGSALATVGLRLRNRLTGRRK